MSQSLHGSAPNPGSLPKAVVLMGVAGCGKTTIGKKLAAELGWRFIEGDSLHPPENIARISGGQPLRDADRAGWLAKIGAEIAASLLRGESVIAACSALKRTYRDRLRGFAPALQILYLEIDPEAAFARVQRRKGHFMPASLVDSQFADLMPPDPDENAVALDAKRTVVELVQEAVALLR
ncbi:gluconokinase [Rhizobiaceae bacterium n13]|uniref:Gluconokinase n=1 Tax=Ferirhizobium litorale TaxID=2927786 RepID=A0AAE3U3M5_9HYPH|nr:gluconokinase [Fererhizobium litorale]MDI7864443.1 gluconokinase [Fererhizobium litorale]MDI7924806.1 gluconokinase [Fererhizobium litorale]